MKPDKLAALKAEINEWIHFEKENLKAWRKESRKSITVERGKAACWARIQAYEQIRRFMREEGL